MIHRESDPRFDLGLPVSLQPDSHTHGPGGMQAGCLPTELSFKHSIQLWLAWGRHGRVENHDDWIALMNAIGQKRVGNRPGRIEPRQKKRRPKPYPWLKKPRPAARRDVIQHGHENKLAA